MFEVGQRVGVIDENHEFKKGTIENFYPVLETALVKFDNDELVKVKFKDLAIIKEEPTENAEEKKEPVEKSEITITPDQFCKIAKEVIRKESSTSGHFNPIRSMAFSFFCEELHKALFVDAWEND